MIIAGIVLLVIGVLALFGLIAGGTGITIYNFILPVIGFVLLIVGIVKRNKNGE